MINADIPVVPAGAARTRRILGGRDRRNAVGGFSQVAGNDTVLRRIVESHRLERVLTRGAGERGACAAAGCAWRTAEADDCRMSHADHVVDVILEAFTVRAVEQFGAMPDGACLVETRGAVPVDGGDGRYHDAAPQAIPISFRS